MKCGRPTEHLALGKAWGREVAGKRPGHPLCGSQCNVRHTNSKAGTHMGTEVDVDTAPWDSDPGG